MTTTHIAGPPVMILGRLVQRCALCGEKLLDSKEDKEVLTVKDRQLETRVFGPGSLVRAEEGNYYVIMVEDCALRGTVNLPTDSCYVLVE